jgi:hypothetical protein
LIYVISVIEFENEVSTIPGWNYTLQNGYLIGFRKIVRIKEF